jgi:class 3 adenylate cyclase/DNA-binding CsgD family transcriptional regulator
METSSALPTGTLTFLFTDIEGSTRLLKTLGRKGYRELLETHNRLIRWAIAEHEGIEVDRQGDSFFAVFRSAGQAVAAAVDAQRVLSDQGWPEGVQVRVRMGLHTGEAALGEEGYVGVAIHDAARVGKAAEGGQILLSSPTATLVARELPVSGRLRDLGERRLPGLDQRERLFTLEAEGVPGSVAPLVSRVRRDIAPADRTLLERETEVALLQELLETARHGDGRLVVVEGSAGIGKTRLLTEARALAGGAGFEVLLARAGEFEGDFAFGIVRQLFEPALAGAPRKVRAELLAGAAELAAPLFTAAVPGGEGAAAETSFAMLHGLYWLAANIAARNPSLLVVDDLHWADDPSLRWLTYLARRIEGLPLLLLVGTRPPEQAQAPRLVAELLADPLATMIRPSALGDRSAATLAQELFGLQPDQAFAATLCQVSGGNPLYLAALLDTVAREEIEPTAEQAPRLLTLGANAVSRGVGLRLSRLPADAIALVRAAAILGDGAELRHAATLAELDLPTAGKTASVLVRSDLLREENPLEFIHPVVRTAVYENMSEGDRLSGHRQAAEALLRAGLPAEQAAAHLQLTLPDGDAFVVATLRDAAKRALAQGAPEAAIAYLRRALDEPPTPEQRVDVLAELGAAEDQTFEVDPAAEHLSEALAALEDLAARPDLVLAYAHALSMLADHAPEAVELVQQLSDRVRGDPDLQERVTARLIIAAHYDAELYPIARERWDGAREADTENAISAGILLATGAIEEARRGLRRQYAIELARRAFTSRIHGTYEALYLVNALYAFALAGRVEEAIAACTETLAACRRHGNRFNTAVMLMWRGILHAEQGELLAAEADISPAEPVADEPPTLLAYRQSFLAEVLLARGANADAQELVASVRLAGVQPGHQIIPLLTRGQVHLETGVFEEALVDLREVGTIADALGIENPAFAPWRSRAALALHRLGRVDEALELAREELELSRRWGAPRTVGISVRALALVEGGAAGEQLLREAVEVLAESPARLEYARALVDLGAALRRANSRSEARERLREGIELALKCGATALVEHANDELAATGAHRRTIMLSGLEALTASERRVAQLAAEGTSNKEIAQSLFVTVKTVEMHLGRVYRKLELNSRAQLADALGQPLAGAASTT